MKASRPHDCVVHDTAPSSQDARREARLDTKQALMMPFAADVHASLSASSPALAVSGPGLAASGPLVTIIIPTYNSKRVFALCASSIQNQTYSNLEVLVVDNYSDDSTADLARSHGFRVLQLHGNRMIARDLGVKEASGDYVLFLDSDHVLDPSCVGRLVERSANRQVDALVLFELSSGSSRWTRLLAKDDAIEFGVHAGIPRWFKRQVIADFEAVSHSGDLHVHGEDRMILAWLRGRNCVIGEALDARLFHNDPPLEIFFRKQFHNTYTGSRGNLLNQYAKVALQSAVHLFNPILVQRSTRSVSTTVCHFCLLFYRVLFQAAGMVASRLARFQG